MVSVFPYHALRTETLTAHYLKVISVIRTFVYRFSGFCLEKPADLSLVINSSSLLQANVKSWG